MRPSQKKTSALCRQLAAGRSIKDAAEVAGYDVDDVAAWLYEAVSADRDQETDATEFAAAVAKALRVRRLFLNEELIEISETEQPTNTAESYAVRFRLDSRKAMSSFLDSFVEELETGKPAAAATTPAGFGEEEEGEEKRRVSFAPKF